MRAPAHDRTPSAPRAREQIKEPRTVEVRARNDRRPAWRIQRLEMVDPFGWHAVPRVDLDDVRSRLAAFESMTWNEILVHAKKQNHAVSVGDLTKVARDRLDELRILEDELVSLRVTGNKRVWGYRAEDGVLMLLWWDPDHSVCKSSLKHT